MEQLRFLSEKQCRAVRQLAGTPAYVYHAPSLRSNALAALDFPNAFGLTVRYAMKAAPNAAILQLFQSLGLCFDCSSVYEVQRALAAGIDPAKLSLSTQELAPSFAELPPPVLVNVCSLAQLRAFGRAYRGSPVGVRFNPGLGSGGTEKTNVGGPNSSFGIWHEQAAEVAAVAQQHRLKVVRIHTHIGSGSDPAVWQRVASMSLELVRVFPDVVTLNLGGGYKVARMASERATELRLVGEPVKAAFVEFARETGRELHLEVEPGTFLVANAGALVCTVQDKVSTPAHTFLKLDAGMTDVLRPSLYGSQHALVVVNASDVQNEETEPVVVVGHCCESGDLLTCRPNEPEVLQERTLLRAQIADILVVEGAGAYCSGMSAKGYNSFPEAPELLLDQNGRIHWIRKRQQLEQVYQNEMKLEPELIQYMLH